MSEAALKIDDLQIEGLHCMDCAATIEKTVAKISGVHNVRASFSSGKVKVHYDPVYVGFNDLVSCIEKIGYRVRSEGHKNLQRAPIWKENAFFLVLFSGIALALGLAGKFYFSDPLAFTIGRDITLSTLLFLLAVVLGIGHSTREIGAAIRNFQLSMDTLMSIAIIGAILIGEYVEAASLAFLFSLAELLERFAVERARDSLRELINLTPDNATVKRTGKEATLAASEIEVGEILVIRPGEKVALDGEVVKGVSSVNQAPITGESVPVTKESGDAVYAGTFNNEGYLEIKVTQNSRNTILAKIIHLVEDAESQKAPVERFVEKFARIYTPTVVSLAIVVASVPPLLLEAEFNPWFIKALTLLVIACPCALVISTPVSVVSALTSASRNGVLIKGGVYLEEMSKVKVIAFDKTGTLTRGQIEVTDVMSLNGVSKNEALILAASLEIHSEHPIAKAIVKAARGNQLETVDAFKALPGRGITGNIHGRKHLVGQKEMFEQLNIAFPKQKLERLETQGKTTMLVGTESEVIALIAVSDQIRPEAVKTIENLKSSGKIVVMLTGDNEQTAIAIATKLGVSEYYAGLLPQDKVTKIKELQEKFGKTAMVGDGINDAPALAAASVGIAMGAAGSDSALETSDIALMADNLGKLPYLLALSDKASAVIKENTVAAILIKFSLALGVLPGFVSLVVAVLVGDMGASLGVISNAMRLARFNLRAKD